MKLVFLVVFLVRVCVVFVAHYKSMTMHMTYINMQP